MTREEAIRILDRRTTIPGDGFDFEQINKAIDIAIEALRGPKVKTNADHIRAMNDDELANQLVIEVNGLEPCTLYLSTPTGKMYLIRTDAANKVKEWLQQPIEED